MCFPDTPDNSAAEAEARRQREREQERIRKQKRERLAAERDQRGRQRTQSLVSFQADQATGGRRSFFSPTGS